MSACLVASCRTLAQWGRTNFVLPHWASRPLPVASRPLGHKKRVFKALPRGSAAAEGRRPVRMKVPPMQRLRVSHFRRSCCRRWHRRLWRVGGRCRSTTGQEQLNTMIWINGAQLLVFLVCRLNFYLFHVLLLVLWPMTDQCRHISI